MTLEDGLPRRRPGGGLGLDIDGFHRLVEEASEDIPDELFRELNGGILVLGRAKKHPEVQGTYVLGEYHVERPGMGRYIVLYFGSFLGVLGSRAEAEEYRRQVWKTLLHEFRHHLESLAGVADLEREDREHLEALYRRHGGTSGAWSRRSRTTPFRR